MDSPGSWGHCWRPSGAAFVRRPEKQREESRQPPHSPRVPVSNGRNPGTPRGWPRPDNVLKRRQQTFLRTKTNFQTQTGGESCACHKEKPPGTPPSSGWEHPLPPVGPRPQPLAVTREHAGTLSRCCEPRDLRLVLARPSGLGCIDLFLCPCTQQALRNCTEQSAGNKGASPPQRPWQDAGPGCACWLVRAQRPDVSGTRQDTPGQSCEGRASSLCLQREHGG